MTTSFSDTIRTEKFLRGEMPAEEALVFEARLLVDERLRRDAVLHGLVHRLVALYHRKKLKGQAQMVSERLFSDESKSFRNDIDKIFNP